MHRIFQKKDRQLWRKSDGRGVKGFQELLFKFFQRKVPHPDEFSGGQGAIYEAEGVFAPAMIDGIIAELKAFNDRTLRADIGNDQKKILALVESYFHCGWALSELSSRQRKRGQRFENESGISPDSFLGRKVSE